MGLPAPASLKTVHRTVFRALASPEDISSRPNDKGCPVTHIINALTEVSGDYDVLFCDLWGCVHNGRVAYPAAIAALQAFRRQGGRVALMTNAPRPQRFVAEQIARLSVPRRWQGRRRPP